MNLTLNEVKTSKYWQNKTFNPAKGGPNDMPNCTDFCLGAFNWAAKAEAPIKMFTDRKAGGFPNAKEWYAKWAFEKGATPKVAATAVWAASSYNYQSGHVAFVKSFNGNTITVYQSNYKGVYFEEKTYTVAVGKVTSGVGAKFIGFCYNPYYVEEKEEEPESELPTFKIGNTYTLQMALNVRKGAGTNYAKKTYWQLSANARKSATLAGVLKKGTKVTCLETKNVSENQVWIRIPSGWICAYQDGTQYIK